MVSCRELYSLSHVPPTAVTLNNCFAVCEVLASFALQPLFEALALKLGQVNFFILCLDSSFLTTFLGEPVTLIL